MERFLLMACMFLSIGGKSNASFGGNECRLRSRFDIPRQLYGVQNWVLGHHSYETQLASTRTMCAAKCLLDSWCLSFNFCPNSETPCELNNSTRAEHEEDFLETVACFYFDRNGDTQLHYDGISATGSATTTASKLTTQSQSTDVSSPLYCQSKTVSGVYTLSAPGSAHDGKEVYCDADTDGGGWLVFQRRTDSATDFYQNRQSYEDGFGAVSGNFWLGNGLVHDVTSTGQWQLRVDLTDWEGHVAYAQYSVFSIGAAPGFRLNVDGYSGNAGDSLAYHNDNEFTTNDYDSDGAGGGNCAQWLNGAWWYAFCHRSALNGKYLTGGGATERDQGLQWTTWKGHEYSMKESKMKIRPFVP